MQPAIRVHNLSKRYRLAAGPRAAHHNLAEAVTGAVSGFARAVTGSRRAAAEPAAEFWALRGVSFDVRPGEVVGIVGRNGAGKSTLLKVLSRITEPTDGRVELRGRVGSLLEVGTGFHPELTGRENIYLNGSILGMTRREIARNFDEIVAFAEVERFLDLPVKRYSSGMYVRLAFAVAAHLDPEILIVDEVLAVGDHQFQEKCLGKMKDVSRTGRTVLFVSHNMTAVQNLCGRAVVLEAGKVVLDGPAADAVRAYLKQSAELEGEWHDDRPDSAARRVRFTAVRVRDAAGAVSAHLDPRRPFALEIDYEVRHPATCQVAFRLNRDDGLTVLTTADGDRDWVFIASRGPGRYRASVTIPGDFLAPGRYHLLVAANQYRDAAFDLLETVLNFEVGAVGSLRQIDHRLGVVLPVLEWETRPLGDVGL